MILDNEKLKYPPYPGELGQRLMENVTRTQWDEWVKIQTRLINEKQLSGISADDRKYLKHQMEQHFFGTGADEADGYVPEKGE